MLDATTAGFVLILIGFAVAVVALLSSVKSTKSEVRGAGVVMIGPIPIVFGSDAKWASVAMGLAIVLVLLSILFYVL